VEDVANSTPDEPTNLILSLEKIAARITELSKQPAGESPEVPEDIMVEINVSRHKVPDIDELKKIAESTSFTCPECGGVLFSVRGEPVSRYICHTGHSFTGDSYLAGQSEIIEYSLWSAVRHLQERIKVFRNMAENEEKRGRTKNADGFKKKADDIDYHVRVIRDFIVSGKAFDNKRRAGDEPLRWDSEKFPKPNASDKIL
jgi:two-component system, chemotaxis family, protein-glutamate methylesterase/glutaminase